MKIYNDRDGDGWPSNEQIIFFLLFFLSFGFPILTQVDFYLLFSDIKILFGIISGFVTQFAYIIIPSVSFFASSALLYHAIVRINKIQHEKSLQKQIIEQKLHSVFYQLLEEKNGYVTVLELAMKANISASHAKTFLNQKMKDFNHEVVLSKEGEIAYKFEFLTKNEIKELS